MIICGLSVDGVPGTNTYIKQMLPGGKKYNCMRIANSYDCEVVVAETTNTIDFHSVSQVRSIRF